VVNARSGVVSVVLVNFRGAADTITAVSRLGEVDWPADALEIVVVDNASGGDDVDRIRAAHPGVQLIESPENTGFAGGCNLGARHSSGEFIAFLNNDARPDPQWIRAAVEAFADPGVGAVASRVLDWEGERVDYIGAAMTWFGQGYKPFTGEPLPPLADEARDVLFATGSAMFVRRDDFLATGGFDERYFMFFEDVDLGWRLNLRGRRVRYVPGSLAFHRHHASMTGFGEHKERYLLERNALFTLYKNASARTLEEALPAAMALAVRRGISLGGLDAREFELRRGGDDGPVQEVSRLALAPVYAIDAFVDELPGLRADREAIQASRVVPDTAIALLAGRTDAAVISEPGFVDGYEHVVEAFDVAEGPRARTVLVITGDPIGAKLAGPAIRAWNMAAALARHHEVVLVSLAGVGEVDAPFQLAHVTPGDDRAMSRWEQWAEVVVFQGTALSVFQSLKDSEKIIVADVYDPMHLEALEQARPAGWASWTKAVADATDILDEQLQRADFMLAASERQRHLYLGQLAGLGRLTPALYEGDPDLRAVLAVVPFGLPSTPPRHERAVVKGVVPGIGPDDKLILWGGGLYNWFDPETLVRAVAELAERRPEVRLFFQGTRHPNPAVPEMEIVARTRELARELGVLDRNVFLNDSWVDYTDRQNYLLEADLGVSTHFDHIETEFSFRTRILDYLWAGLPMVVTEGDHFADLVESRGLGIAVPAEETSVLADAIERMLFDEELRAAAIDAVARTRDESTWERVLQPLLDFVANPAPARDRVTGAPRAAVRSHRKRAGIRHDLSLVGYYLKAGGPSLVIWKVRNRLRRRPG